MTKAVRIVVGDVLAIRTGDHHHDPVYGNDLFLLETDMADRHGLQQPLVILIEQDVT